MPHLKTLEDARNMFARTGKTIRKWAQEIGVHENTVYEVLAGRKRCLRGDAHKVAVLLGIKDGVIDGDRQ